MLHPRLQYSKLKMEILIEAGSFFSLDLLKEHFSTLINSRRSVGRIKSLACLIHLLEERDILNWRNVDYLQQLGEFLQNYKIQEYVQSYKKLYLDGIEEKSCVCGVETAFVTNSSPLSHQLENRCLIQSNNHADPDIKEAVLNVSQRIGKDWSVLARALDVRECDIDNIPVMYPRNFQKQAQAALDIWITKARENASVEILTRALEERHCKRFGIGSFMLEPL